MEYERWVEFFMGTGVVAFNVRPKKALLCDSNPHLIRFYKALQDKEITSGIVKNHLTEEGKKLLSSEGKYYYEVRQRFNEEKKPLDFLFLSRSCFNGMMRFNRKGGFNVPFCKKPNRFAQSLVTKISNQVDKISQIIELGDYTFKNQDFAATLEVITNNDLIYCDPPYLGRHVDYFDSWSELIDANAKFILSTWLKNKYRTNEYIFSIWKECFITTKEHFYHIEGKEENRNAVYEAILSNIKLENSVSNQEILKRINNEQSLLTSRNSAKNTTSQLGFKFV